jgi:hypothetical protein
MTGQPPSLAQGSATSADQLAPLLYWFPGADRIPAAWQQRVGPASGIWGRLTGLLRGDGYSQRPGQPGPTAATAAGLLVAVGELALPITGDAVRYEPARQDWCEIEPGVWAGLADTATPADFARRRMLAPLVYVLTQTGARRADWYVPVARLASARCAIPMQDRFERGEWRRVPAPEYAALSAIAERLYDAETGACPQPSPEYIRNAAVTALQCNYALTGPELALFGVLNDSAYDAISAILTDREARTQKKTTAAAG